MYTRNTNPGIPLKQDRLDNTTRISVNDPTVMPVGDVPLGDDNTFAIGSSPHIFRCNLFNP